jgi:glycosyltransferase involved in cell wall biosynthesis
MAAGLPVVADDCADHREFVEHGVQGLLVPFARCQPLAETIGMLFEAPGTAERMGQSGCELVRSSHSLSSSAAEHLQLFNSLIASRKGN